MATQQETIEVTLKDLASKALRKVVTALDKMRTSAKQTEDSTDKAGEAFNRFEKGVLVANAGLSLLQQGLGMATGGMKQAYAAVRELTEAADAYQFAEAALDAALRSSTMSQEEGTRVKAQALALSRDLAQQAGVEETAVQRLIARNLALGGSYKDAAENATLAIDIMGRTGKDLTASTEALIKVRRGHASALAELVDLSKEEEQALERMSSKQARTARMVAILQERYAGARSEIQGTQVATQNLTSAQTALNAAIGRAIDESGVFGAVLAPVTKRLYEQADAAKSSKKQIQLYALEVGGRVVSATQSAAKIIVGLVTAVKLAGIGIEAFAYGAGVAFLGLQTLVGKMVASVVGNFDALVQSMASVVEGFQRFAQLSGNQKLINAAESTAQAFQRVREHTAAMASQRGREAEALLEGYKAAKRGLVDYSKAADKVIDDGANRIVAIDKVAAEAQANLKKRRDAIIASEGAATKVATNQEKVRQGLKKESLAIDAKAAESTKRQIAMRKLEMRILLEQDQRKKATLEYDLAILKAREDTAKITNEALRTATLDKLTLEAKIALTERRGEIEKQLFEAAQKRAEEARKHREEDVAEARRLAGDFASSLDEIGAQFTAMENAGLGMLSRLAPGMRHLTTLAGDVNTAMVESAKGTEKAGQATAAALSTAGKAVAGFAVGMGASAAEASTIMGLFETAASIASFAAGDFVGGAGHALAATTFYAVAAKGGESGGATPTAVGAGGAGAQVATGGSAGGSTANAEAGAEILAERLAESLGGGNTTIYLDMRDSLVVDDGGLYDRASRGAKERGIDLEIRR